MGQTVGYFAWFAVYNLFISPLRHFPGPKLWAISQLPYARMYMSGLGHRKILDMHQKYGYAVRVAPNQVSLVGPDAWKDTMGHRKYGQDENGKDPVFYKANIHSILGADREDHARMRRVFSHAFSMQGMLEQEPLISRYIDLLFERLKQNSNAGSKPVDVVKWYNYTTFDVVGDLAFGEPFGCLETSEYHPWVALIFDSVKETMLAVLVRRIWPYLDTLGDVFRGKNRKMKRAERVELTNMKITKRMSLGVSRPDFMETMITENQSGQKKMTMQEIRATTDTLIIAGSETTATALSGVTFYLCKNPNVLAKLTDEIRSSFASEGEVTLLSVQKLKYMLAVLDESMRLFPPFPGPLPRSAKAGGDVICGKFVPSGTVLNIWQWAMYHHPDNFTMQDSFVPERWLGDKRFINDRKDAFQPFSHGARNCIGRNLAYAEMRLILARLLWNFNIKLAEESEHWDESSMTYTMWQKGPLHVYLTPRQVEE
ncbi:hypothetical protein FOYG_17461 [Fusarium oxysporum NRRL 32931]|uniref:Uncharacterized protein n=1 Tax=Fusarium oxysporum NRRL 32931 TaxID=660029 RepID=W9H9X6_FUSOX|nr:hypothetical protein FOYG_17461 [Fusarium oxysporum NRRL 32931]